MIRFCTSAFVYFYLSLAIAYSEGKVKIGVIVPLTGPLAEFGVALKNGIELAQKTEKELLSRIQFQYEDSQYNPQTAILIFRKYAADPDMKVIINFGCPTSQAIAPLAEQTKVPTALFCSALLLTKDKHYSFGMCSPADEWASILWSYLQSERYQKLCLLLTQNDYLMSEFQALQAEIEKSNSQRKIEVLDQYTPQETDFRSSVLKLPSKGCDALGVYLLPGQIRTYFEQSRHLNLKAQIFGTDVFESPEEIAASKRGMERSVFVNLSVPKEFKTSYLGDYKNENQVTMACIAHDLVVRLGKIFKEDRGLNAPEKIMEAIKQSGSLRGACGTSEFVNAENGEQFLRFPLELKQIVAGEIKSYVQ